MDNEILSANTNMLIAYEPIWAISTGLTATPDMANEVHAHIHTVLSEMSSNRIPMLYGGSMKSSNAIITNGTYSWRFNQGCIT